MALGSTHCVPAPSARVTVMNKILRSSFSLSLFPPLQLHMEPSEPSGLTGCVCGGRGRALLLLFLPCGLVRLAKERICYSGLTAEVLGLSAPSA